MSRNSVIFVEWMKTLHKADLTSYRYLKVKIGLILYPFSPHTPHKRIWFFFVLPISAKGVSIHLVNKANKTKKQGDINDSSFIPISSWFPYPANSIWEKVWPILSPQSIPLRPQSCSVLPSSFLNFIIILVLYLGSLTKIFAPLVQCYFQMVIH